MVTECCSDSRMRSRTSRGVPEWSGGEDLYIGSQVSAIGKVSGVIGIVPRPPEGSRGSTGWGHLPRGAHGLYGVRLGLYGPRAPAPRGPCAKRRGERKSPKGGRHLLGALGRMDSSLAAPFLGGRAKAAPPPFLWPYI